MGVERLLEAKADPSRKDKQGRSPVTYAKQRGKTQCAQTISDWLTSRQQECHEVERARMSAFAPFLRDETTPYSKGLPLVVYHQVQFFISRRVLFADDMTEGAISRLRSLDTCTALSVLKEYAEKRTRRESRGRLEDACHNRSRRVPLLLATRGADYPPGQSHRFPIEPRFLMMTHDEVTVMHAMGCTVQEYGVNSPHLPHLDKVYKPVSCRRGLVPFNAIFSTPYFEVAKAQHCLRNLNAITLKVAEKDMQMWEDHTFKTLLNKDVEIAVRDAIPPEMRTGDSLEMLEILSAYRLVESERMDPRNLNSLHLCEAKGQFEVARTCVCSDLSSPSAVPLSPA